MVILTLRSYNRWMLILTGEEVEYITSKTVQPAEKAKKMMSIGAGAINQFYKPLFDRVKPTW